MEEERVFIREITEIVNYQRGIGRIKFYLSNSIIQDLFKKGYQEKDIEYTVYSIPILKDIELRFDDKFNLLDIGAYIFYQRS